MWRLIMAACGVLAMGIGGAAAQCAPAGPTRWITLGTLAGPFPRAHRAQTSNLLIVNGSCYVVDAGDGVARRLYKTKVKMIEIGTIFLTHQHDDHSGGMGMLMSVIWDSSRTRPIEAYGPKGTERLVQAARDYYTESSQIRIADGGRTVPIAGLFIGYDVGPGVVYQDKNLTVRAIANTHFAFHNGGRGDDEHVSYSYRFEAPDRVIMLTGDTGYFDGLIELAKGADLLVSEANSVEARKQLLVRGGQWDIMSETERARIMVQAANGHMSTADVGKLAAAAGVKSVVLTHLTEIADDNYAPWADEVKKVYAGPVVIARDLGEY